MPKEILGGTTKMSFPQGDGIPKAALEGAEGRGEKGRNRKTGWGGEVKRGAGERA